MNGHEWVENHKKIAQLDIVKESNCFTSYNNGENLSQIADTLKHQRGNWRRFANGGSTVVYGLRRIMKRRKKRDFLTGILFTG